MLAKRSMILISLTAVLLSLLTVGCSESGETGTYDSQQAPSYTEPEPEYTSEPEYMADAEWQYVTSVSGSGGRYSTLEAASSALGEANDTKARSERFALTGGPVKLRYRVKSTGEHPYIMVAMTNVRTGDYGQGGGSLDLETDFTTSGNVRLEKEEGRYVMYVAAVNCDWELDVYELK